MVSDELKRVIAEWVLTNGTLEGFEGRVRATLPEWSVVGKDETLVVYRAQGGDITTKRTADPSNLIPGVRPVLATSKDELAILRYAGAECCIFKITLGPGIHYIDVNKTVTFNNEEGKTVLGVKNTVLKDICSEIPRGAPTWPTSATPAPAVRQAMLDRCMGRVKYDTKGTPKEYVPSEQEIMVYGLEGTFSAPTEIDAIGGKRAFEVTYSLPAGGVRGRTFRRKAKRLNKNGRRSARQSRRYRNSHA